MLLVAWNACQLHGDRQLISEFLGTETLVLHVQLHVSLVQHSYTLLKVIRNEQKLSFLDLFSRAPDPSNQSPSSEVSLEIELESIF